MSSNRFNNTLRSVRQHNYRNDEDRYYKGPFREESNSKIYFSIKPTDKMKKENPHTTSRAKRKRMSTGLYSNKRKHGGVNRYANGIKMSDRKKSFQFKGIERPSLLGEDPRYDKENYGRVSSKSYRPMNMTDRGAPTFFDKSEILRKKSKKFISRSKSAIKNKNTLDIDKFTQTMRNNKNHNHEDFGFQKDYLHSRRTMYSNKNYGGAYDKFSGMKFEEDDRRSPYKRYNLEMVDQSSFDSKNIIIKKKPTDNSSTNNKYQKFYYPSFIRTGAKSNSSMISSRSYEVIDGLGKENKDNNMKNDSKKMLQMKKMVSNVRTTRDSLLPNMNTSSKKSHNLFFDFASKCTNTLQHPTTPDDSYIFKPAYDTKSFINNTTDGRQKFAVSPGVSARRGIDKSRVSALDRSDLSMRSKVSNNNSYITRREASGDPSKIKGIPCDSKLKNMSKTWVRSHLLDSREDISTFKYKQNPKIDISHSVGKKPKKKVEKKLELDKLFLTSKDSHQRDIRAKEYELKKCIGQGAYAKVYKAVHLPTESKVAVKLYEKSKLNDKLRQKSIKREIKILSKIHHENIVNFIDCFATTNHIYLVMELVEGLSLYELLKKQPKRKISEENARSIIKQILRALNYCHSRNVTHRDIKLENVIVSNEGVVKIIDFGFSTCIPNDKKVRMFCGTPSYMAPEIVKKIEYRGPPVDIWATGVLFYVLLSGKFPFRGSTDKKLYYRISYSEIKFNSDIRQEVRDVISCMMGKAAEDRPNCKKLLEGYFCSRKYLIKDSKDHSENKRSKSKKSAVLKELSQNNTARQKKEGTNQFNNLLKKLDNEYQAVKSSSIHKGGKSKRLEREKILSKYLNKSKTSYRAKSPQTMRNPIDSSRYLQKSANRMKHNPSYIYFERSRRMLDNIITDRGTSGYSKGDFTKFLENGKMPY